eukprot:5996371-Alexandrium_andersonii.AAC.1
MAFDGYSVVPVRLDWQASRSVRSSSVRATDCFPDLGGSGCTCFAQPGSTLGDGQASGGGGGQSKGNP